MSELGSDHFRTVLLGSFGALSNPANAKFWVAYGVQIKDRFPESAFTTVAIDALLKQTPQRGVPTIGQLRALLEAGRPKAVEHRRTPPPERAALTDQQHRLQERLAAKHDSAMYTVSCSHGGATSVAEAMAQAEEAEGVAAAQSHAEWMARWPGGLATLPALWDAYETAVHTVPF